MKALQVLSRQKKNSQPFDAGLAVISSHRYLNKLKFLLYDDFPAPGF